MEELRAVYADRLVINCINQKIITAKHLQKQENGAVLLTDDGRKAFLTAWQNKKKEEITHPFLKENCLGLVPMFRRFCWPVLCAATWKCTHRFSGSEVPLCWCL